MVILDPYQKIFGIKLFIHQEKMQIIGKSSKNKFLIQTRPLNALSNATKYKKKGLKNKKD